MNMSKSTILFSILLLCTGIFLVGCGVSIKDVREMGEENDTASLIDIIETATETDIKKEAIVQLGKQKNPEYWDVIYDYIDDPSYNEVCVKALFDMNPLEHPEFFIKAYLCRATKYQTKADDLVRQHLTQLTPFLLKQVRHENYRIRSWIASLLDSAEHSESKKTALIQFTLDENSMVRESAVIALGNMQDPTTRDTLNDLKNNDENDDVRLEAAKALDKILTVRNITVSDVVIGIVPFKNLSSDQELNKFEDEIPSRIAAILSNQGLCRVVEQAEMQRAIDTIMTQQSDFYDQTTTNAVGYFLGSQQIIFGYVEKNGAEVTIVAKRMEVETGMIMNGYREIGYKSEMNQLIESLIDSIVNSF